MTQMTTRGTVFTPSGSPLAPVAQIVTHCLRPSFNLSPPVVSDANGQLHPDRRLYRFLPAPILLFTKTYLFARDLAHKFVKTAELTAATTKS